MNKRNDQQGGTRAVLGSGSKNKLDAIAGKGRPADNEAAQERTVATKPQRVKKTISISVDTILAIKRIQEHRLINEGKSPTDSALIDEAVMELLRQNNLSL